MKSKGAISGEENAHGDGGDEAGADVRQVEVEVPAGRKGLGAQVGPAGTKAHSALKKHL